MGIALGLLDFDATNVEGSVPSLLNGLKTAFLGSVFGVFFALTIKGRHYLFGVGNKLGDPDPDVEVTAADLANLLKRIQQALVGSDDATLVSQMKLTRADTNERLDALKRDQQEALQKLGEMGSSALVEALREVILDFNAKVNEQFGENFKQLNLAVGKLLVWQEQFKSYITEATERHNQVIASMKVASDKYTQLVDQAGTFSVVAKDLSSLLAALQEQKQQITAALSYLGNLLRTTESSWPKIEERMLAMTEQLAKAVKDNQEMLSKALADNSQDLRKSLQAAGRDISKANQDFNEDMRSLMATTKEQAVRLETELETTLTLSLRTLAEQLATLSNTFAADYTPITQKLHKVLTDLRLPA